MDARPAKLIVIVGATQGVELPLVGRAALLGRGTDCDLPLLDNYASRHHCWIEPRDEAWWVRDLGSKNGTLVGGERIAGEQLLSDGDVITVGSTQLRFCDTSETKTYHALPAQPPGRLAVDLAARSAWVDGAMVDPPLSPKQWLLLASLWTHRGQAMSKDDLARAVWPEAEGVIYDYQLDKLVSRLRARLGDAGDALIETVWGFGFKLR